MKILRAKWATWKRHQPSRTRYALVTAGTRIVSAGLSSQSRLVELRSPVMF